MRVIAPAWRANSISHNWFNEFDQVFENAFEHKLNQKTNIACDVEESEKFILFSFDLPGLEEKDIQIELKNSVLQVSGERKEERPGEAIKKFSGRRYGSFLQRFSLPKSVDQEKIEADYTSGVLKVLLPKTKAEQPKKVEVKTRKGKFLSDLLKGKQED